MEWLFVSPLSLSVCPPPHSRFSQFPPRLYPAHHSYSLKCLSLTLQCSSLPLSHPIFCPSCLPFSHSILPHSAPLPPLSCLYLLFTPPCRTHQTVFLTFAMTLASCIGVRPLFRGETCSFHLITPSSLSHLLSPSPHLCSPSHPTLLPLSYFSFSSLTLLCLFLFFYLTLHPLHPLPHVLSLSQKSG